MKTAVFSLLAAGAMVSAHKASTTSTVYTTSIYTITSCAPEVTNCPAKMGQVTTDIISLYTTVCPVTETESPSSTMTPPPVSTSAPYSTSTIYETTEYTITSCPPEVTNCPVGSKTSSVITSTSICSETSTTPPPMTSAGYSVSTIYTTTEYTITKCPASVTNCPYGSKTTETITSTTICPPTMTSAPAPPPMSSPGGPVKSSGVVVPPPMSMSSPSLSVITISTCVPSYITSVITVSPSATVCPGCAMTTGSSYSPPPKNNGTVVPFTGGASAKQAGGLLMAVGIAAALL